MNRLELLILVVVAAMVFILEFAAIVRGINGVRLGLALGILGVVVGYIGKGLVYYSKKK